MATGNELAKLETDFLTGRNPLAYIPLCNALRRDRRYAQALEFCQRGLTADPNSIAGRTLLARLLADMGRYQESLNEIERAEYSAPGSMGLLVEKVRCLIRLHQVEEADEVLQQLDLLNPMDPQVQVLRGQVRQLKRTVRSSSVENVVRYASAITSVEDIARSVKTQVSSIARVLTIAVLDLDSGKSLIEGIASLAEQGEALFQEVTMACKELDQGMACWAYVELSKCQVLVVNRARRLVILAIDPKANFGKVHHRIQILLDQYFPKQDGETAVEEEE